MKQLAILLFVLLSSVIISACEKDEKPCKAPAISENIVGDWKATYVSDPALVFPLHFTKDGGYTEEQDLLLGVYYSPVAKWKITGEKLIIYATYSNKTNTSYECSVLKNECDKIVLKIDGLDDIELTRDK